MKIDNNLIYIIKIDELHDNLANRCQVRRHFEDFGTP